MSSKNTPKKNNFGRYQSHYDYDVAEFEYNHCTDIGKFIDDRTSWYKGSSKNEDLKKNILLETKNRFPELNEMEYGCDLINQITRSILFNI